MKQIKLLDDLDIKEIVQLMLNGETVYRINTIKLVVSRLNDKSLHTILNDEETRPHMYAYFSVVGEAVNGQ